ncbi:MAG: hypothetical protein V1709_04470 [Planctomycetota bacterium]
MKRNMTEMNQKGIPPGALESEVLSINEAKRSIPTIDRRKGTIWSKRRGALRHQFNGREKEIWSPEFYREWLEYVEAVENGELSGY